MGLYIFHEIHPETKQVWPTTVVAYCDAGLSSLSHVSAGLSENLEEFLTVRKHDKLITTPTESPFIFRKLF